MREMNHFSFAHLKRYLTGLLSFLLLTGCYLSPFPFEYLNWNIELTKIEKPSQSEGSYGALRNISSGQFEDGLVKIEAETKDPMQAFFVLTNKSQYDLKIDWRKAKFVDIYGRTHPVRVTQMQHRGLDNLTEGHTQDDDTLTEIKRAQFVRIRVTPPDRPYIRRVWGWEIPGMRGSTLQVLFPLEIEGKSYEYVSTFEVTRFGVSH